MNDLLGKLLGQTNSLLKAHEKQLNLTPDFCRRLSAIETIKQQQDRLFEGKKVSNRLVSVDKPYIRPIVGGKETKTVEFGAKCNNIHIDGISFIEHISFNAFNEGTRLKQCVFQHHRLMKTHVRALTAVLFTPRMKITNFAHATISTLLLCAREKREKKKNSEIFFDRY